MNQELKDSVQKLGLLYAQLGGASAKEQVMTEFKRFACYIVSSNSAISEGEPEAISEVFGKKISAQELANYIAAEQIFTLDFATEVPKAFRQFIQNPNASQAYLKLMELLGKEIIISDEEAEIGEVNTLNAYMTMLYDFYNENHADHPLTYLPPEAQVEVTAEQSKPSAAPNDEETLEDLLKELDSLIGLDSVKKNVYSLLHLQSIQMEREKRGLPKIPMSNHLVFTGNPGTGKTTVARLIARIYHKIGLLSTGAFVEVDRSGMVAGYVGQTAIEVKNVMDSAKGGVLFIDEAYSLATGLKGDYGMEAIDTLLKRMEDDREDIIVIVAGYPDLMEKFISSNPGLRSRFSKKIFFPDYEPDALLEILKSMAKKQKFIISDEALQFAKKMFIKKHEHRSEDFANAREVRNFFESAVVSQADRLYEKENLTDEDLCRLEAQDFRYNELMID